MKQEMALTAKDMDDVRAALEVERKIRALASNTHLPEHHLDRARADARKLAHATLSAPAQVALERALQMVGVLKIDLTPAQPGWLGSLGGEAA